MYPTKQPQTYHETRSHVPETDYWPDRIGNITSPLFLSLVLFLLWRNDPMCPETVVTMTNQGTCVELCKTFKSLVLHERLEGLQKGMSKLTVSCC